MKRLAIVGAGLVVGAVGAGAWWAASGGLPALGPDGSAAATPEPSAELATAPVERRTLLVTDEFSGTLGYGEAIDLPGGLAGVVTWVAPAGSIVAIGERLYETDGTNRATLLRGDRPAWRTLEDGVEDGTDIRQLEASLVELGFDPAGMTVDGHWDDDTTEAVEAWQAAKRLEADGVVQLGEVVFATGPIRVGAVVAGIGTTAGPGATILRATSTERQVTLAVSATDRADLAIGTEVDIELPDGTTTPGTVTEVGGVATTDQASGETTFEVLIGLDDPAAAGDLDEAPVDVALVSEEREDVLTVPVHALLALLEGGYAVEVVEDDGSTRLVGVDPGLFDGGYVEISAEGLPDGTLVVVPS